MKVTVVGAGNVGATVANVLAQKKFCSEVVLVDIKDGVPQGKAMDIMQTAHMLNFNTRVVGVTAQPGDENGYPVHRHGSHEILLPLGGRCGMIISDTVYELDPGDAVLILKDTPHKLITEDKPVEFLAAQFIPRVCASPDLEPALEEFAEYGKSGGAVFSVSEGVINTVRACMARICDERTDTDIGMYFTYIRSVLYELSHNSVPKHGVVTAKKSTAKKTAAKSTAKKTTTRKTAKGDQT